MGEKVKIALDDATMADYYELKDILATGNISAEIETKGTTGNEMGFEFNELVVLLPLLTPYVVQLRKVLVAYFTYKKPLDKKTQVTLEYKGKKLKITSENEMLPSVEELMTFFGKDIKDSSVK